MNSFGFPVTPVEVSVPALLALPHFAEPMVSVHSVQFPIDMGLYREHIVAHRTAALFLVVAERWFFRSHEAISD